MKNKLYLIVFTISLIIIGLIWVNSDIFAQGNEDKDPKVEVPENIPFIDRNGDGINDGLQYGWGLRFLQRHKMRQEIKEGLNPDGKGDKSMREFMQEKLDELVDSNGDGVINDNDVTLRELMHQRFGTFDRDGDGKPDIGTPEEIRQHMQEIYQWRQQMQQKIEGGFAPSIDEDGDGFPDFPEGPGMNRRKGDSKSDNNPDKK